MFWYICPSIFVGGAQPKKSKNMRCHLGSGHLKSLCLSTLLGQTTNSSGWKYTLADSSSINWPVKKYLVGGFNPVENISQIWSFPQEGVKIKKKSNHHPGIETWIIGRLIMASKDESKQVILAKYFHGHSAQIIQIKKSTLKSYDHFPTPNMFVI